MAIKHGGRGPGHLSRWPKAAGSSAPSNAEAADWVARVITAGGTVSAGTEAAAITMMNDLDTAGIRSKILRMNMFAGTGLAACLVPIIKDAGSATDTNTNFVSGDYSEATGLQGDGSSKYLSTGLIPSTDGISDNGASLGAYVRADRANANTALLGQYSSAVGGEYRGFVLQPRFADLIIFDSFSSGTGRATASSSSTLGFYAGSRQSATDSRVYRNGVQQGSTLGTSQASPPHLAMEIFRNGAEFGNYSNDLIAGYFIGTGLSPSDMSNLYNIWQAFQTELGREV